MIKKLYLLTKRELLIQNRIHDLIKYQVMFFLFCTFSVTLINNQEDIKKYGLIFSVICLPISLLGFANLVIKRDLEDGNLELLLSNFTSLEIIFAKFFSIYISSLLSLVFIVPTIYVIFDLNFTKLIYLLISLITLLSLSSALISLTGAIQSYFRSNTNILATLIMPLLIPNIVITGLILDDSSNIQLMFVMIGINLILLPIILFSTSYLVKNIYNI